MMVGDGKLLARHQPQQKPKSNETEEQRAPKAESETQHHFGKFAKRAQESHHNPPTFTPSAAAALACRLFA
jgi:hypothetical protein